jgi:hypothetical protein
MPGAWIAKAPTMQTAELLCSPGNWQCLEIVLLFTERLGYMGVFSTKWIEVKNTANDLQGTISPP